MGNYLIRLDDEMICEIKKVELEDHLIFFVQDATDGVNYMCINISIL